MDRADEKGPAPRLAVSVVLWHRDALLLVRRRGGPYAGRWSLPGGRVAFGEQLTEAALRELREETAVTADIVASIGPFEVILLDVEPPVHFVVVVFAAVYRSGSVRAGDDAAAAEWVPRAQLAALELTPESRAAIAAAEAA